MHDAFEIPVTWKDVEISFQARLIPSGYITRMGVDVYGEEIVFEPDEEGKYRVVIDPALLSDYPITDIALLKEIANVLNSVNETSAG